MEKQKQYYTVKVEATAPIELTYRVWAEDPEEALEIFETSSFYSPPRPILSRMRKIKATVYRSGTTIIETIKNFRG